MKSICISQWFFSQEDQEDYKKISQIWEKLPEISFKTTKESSTHVVSCHHLAHAFWSFFPRWRVMDWYYHDSSFPHSRLENCEHMEYFWEYRNKPRNIKILDIYPVGWVSPQLIYGHYLSPYKKIYSPWTLDLTNTEIFLQEVEEIKNEIHTILLSWKK